MQQHIHFNPSAPRQLPQVFWSPASMGWMTYVLVPGTGGQCMMVPVQGPGLAHGPMPSQFGPMPAAHGVLSHFGAMPAGHGMLHQHLGPPPAANGAAFIPAAFTPAAGGAAFGGHIQFQNGAANAGSIEEGQRQFHGPRIEELDSRTSPTPAARAPTPIRGETPPPEPPAPHSTPPPPPPMGYESAAPIAPPSEPTFFQHQHEFNIHPSQYSGVNQPPADVRPPQDDSKPMQKEIMPTQHRTLSQEHLRQHQQLQDENVHRSHSASVQFTPETKRADATSTTAATVNHQTDYDSDNSSICSVTSETSPQGRRTNPRLHAYLKKQKHEREQRLLAAGVSPEPGYKGVFMMRGAIPAQGNKPLTTEEEESERIWNEYKKPIPRSADQKDEGERSRARERENVRETEKEKHSHKWYTSIPRQQSTDNIPLRYGPVHINNNIQFPAPPAAPTPPESLFSPSTTPPPVRGNRNHPYYQNHYTHYPQNEAPEPDRRRWSGVSSSGGVGLGGDFTATHTPLPHQQQARPATPNSQPQPQPQPQQLKGILKPSPPSPHDLPLHFPSAPPNVALPPDCDRVELGHGVSVSGEKKKHVEKEKEKKKRKKSKKKKRKKSRSPSTSSSSSCSSESSCSTLQSCTCSSDSSNDSSSESFRRYRRRRREKREKAYKKEKEQLKRDRDFRHSREHRHMSDGRGSTKVEFTAFTNERGEQSERGWHHRRSSGEVEGEKRRKSKSKKSSRDRVDRTAVNTSTTTNHNVSVDVGVGAQMQGQTLPQPPQQPLQQLPQHHTYLSGSQGDGGVAMQFPGAYPPPQNMIPRGEMVQVQHPPPQATIATNNTVILQQQQPQPQIMAAAEGTSNEYIPRATENFHSRDKTRVWGAFIAIGRRSRSSSPAKEKRWKKKEKEWITREVFGSGGHGEGCEECRDGGQN